MINLDPNSRILIQGITEPLAIDCAARMISYGTNIVAGVMAGFGGQTIASLPVFDMVEEAQQSLGPIDTTLIFNPPYTVKDVALEAIAAGINQIIIITKAVPPLDIICLLRKTANSSTSIIGSGSAGILAPDHLLLGIYDQQLFTSGNVAIISRSYSLIYEVTTVLNRANLGESMVIHLGSDPIVSSSARQWLEYLQQDPKTLAIVILGDIFWDTEESTTAYFSDNLSKPVIAYLPGIYSNTSKPLADTVVILSHNLSKPINNADTVNRRIDAFKKAKIPVAKKPSQIPQIVKRLLKNSPKI